MHVCCATEKSTLLALLWAAIEVIAWIVIRRALASYRVDRHLKPLIPVSCRAQSDCGKKSSNIAASLLSHITFLASFIDIKSYNSVLNAGKRALKFFAQVTGLA